MPWRISLDLRSSSSSSLWSSSPSPPRAPAVIYTHLSSLRLSLPLSPLCLSASLPEVSGGPAPIPEGLRLLAARRLSVSPGLHQRQEGCPVAHWHPQAQAARQWVATIERPGRRPSQTPLPLPPPSPPPRLQIILTHHHGNQSHRYSHQPLTDCKAEQAWKPTVIKWPKVAVEGGSGNPKGSVCSNCSRKMLKKGILS